MIFCLLWFGLGKAYWCVNHTLFLIHFLSVTVCSFLGCLENYASLNNLFGKSPCFYVTLHKVHLHFIFLIYKISCGKLTVNFWANSNIPKYMNCNLWENIHLEFSFPFIFSECNRRISNNFSLSFSPVFYWVHGLCFWIFCVSKSLDLQVYFYPRNNLEITLW